MSILIKFISNKKNLFLLTFIVLAIFPGNVLKASSCKRVAESVYKLKVNNIHRLCLINEYSETPPHFVSTCKKNPGSFFFRNKKILFSEIDNETLCTDKYILMNCHKDSGFLFGPKFRECYRVKKKYKGQRF